MAEQAITHSRVLKIAIPIVISNATVPILGVVDTGVVGQMGEAVPIGAVGIGAIILTAIYWIFGFLRMGTVGLTSQAVGAKNAPEVAALLSRVLLIGFAAGLFMILAQAWLFWGAFKVSPASAEVESLARDYMAIRVWSAPATIALYGITGWLIAQERTRAVLAIQVVMNGVNILLDLLFVLQFQWGVEGVAWATFLAEWGGLALGLWLCRGNFVGDAWRNWSRVFDRAKLINMAAIVELSWATMWEEMEQGSDLDLAPRRLPKTIDFSVDYLRSGLPRDAYARARVNRSGRRYASVHVEAWQDNRSRLFAQATGHFLMPSKDG